MFQPDKGEVWLVNFCHNSTPAPTNKSHIHVSMQFCWMTSTCLTMFGFWVQIVLSKGLRTLRFKWTNIAASTMNWKLMSWYYLSQRIFTIVYVEYLYKYLLYILIHIIWTFTVKRYWVESDDDKRFLSRTEMFTFLPLQSIKTWPTWTSTDPEYCQTDSNWK